MSRWIADAWEDVGVESTIAARVENQLRPHFERLLDIANADSATVGSGIDEASLAFIDALRKGLDSDLT